MLTLTPVRDRGSLRRRHRPANGFSMIEMLVVVVLFSVLAAIAYPKIDMDRQRAIAGMLSVGTALQTAQREAVSKQFDVVVAFDTVASRVVLIYDANSNGVRDGAERQRVYSLNRDVAFNRPGAATARAFGGAPISFAVGATGFPSVTFRRSGSASGAGGFYITSTKAARGAARRVTDTRAIEIIRATGRVEWFRWDGSAWQRGF